MRFLGVDPGSHGAIAVLTEDGSIHAVHDMPSVEVKVGKTKRTRVSTALLSDLMREITDMACIVTVEDVGGFSGQSCSAAFTFGRACGQLEGVLTALQLPVAYVTPQKWKKAAGIVSDKGAAREAAMRLWPAHAHLFKRVMDADRAEACLLARHGWLSVQRAVAA
ncbi:MAG: hypothetical protein B7Z68_04070 [Acidobacteria bacterium 21-70-11]|nr:MAG: hypothetical protein B7Z68_04070 [Acidobacteria bacterium 21-70-11]